MLLVFTAPDAPYTHWKQTTFFFEKLDIQVQTGEKLTGTFLLTQDPVKPVSRQRPCEALLLIIHLVYTVLCH